MICIFLQVAYDSEGKMKLVTVIADAPLHVNSSSDTFSAPGSASDENLEKLLDRKLDEGNSRLLVTGRLALDEAGKAVPDTSQPATILVMGPLLDTDEGEGKPAGKASAKADTDAAMKPLLDKKLCESLKKGAIAFSAPKTLGNDWVAVKGRDVTVDLAGKLVTDQDLGLDRAKVMVKGAVVNKDGKVRTLFCVIDLIFIQFE